MQRVKYVLLQMTLLLALLSAPASAQQLLESYNARLSSRDHFNSNGKRLRNPAAIMRQDRANFHRFGRRDAADQSDSFFASKANRARMERMLSKGSSSRAVRNLIVNRTPVVRVEIYGQGNRGTHIRVVVP